MPSTSRGYPYPSGSDDVDIPGDMQALADAVNTDVGAIAATTPSAPVLQTLADAAGDLIVASANDTFAKKSLGTDNHVLTVDTAGSGVAKVAWEDPTANPLTVTAMAAKVSTSTVGNLLTANQASLESNATTGWAIGENCTLAASTTQAKAGTYSLRVTAVASSYMDVITSGYIPVTAGQTYTVSGQSRAGSAAREISPFVVWYDAGNVELSATANNKVTNSTSGWTRHLSTAVAPATATQAKVMFRVYLAGASEIHYLDEMGLWEGAGGQWALPGTPITNQGFYTDESCGRRLFQWDANNSRWQMTYGDTGWRDITADMAGAYRTADPNACLHIRRVNDRIEIRLARGVSGTWTSGAIYALPDAFRCLPAGALAHIASTGLMDYGSGLATSATLWTATSVANLTTNGWSATTDYRGHLTYSTNYAWPTTLPGSAVGSIPA